MNITTILKAFKSKVQLLYGDNLVQLKLFGSFARGDNNNYSDIDIMVLLHSKEENKEEILSDISYSFLLNDEVVINAISVIKHDFENSWNPLYINIKKEGTLI